MSHREVKRSIGNLVVGNGLHQIGIRAGKLFREKDSPHTGIAQQIALYPGGGKMVRVTMGEAEQIGLGDGRGAGLYPVQDRGGD